MPKHYRKKYRKRKYKRRRRKRQRYPLTMNTIRTTIMPDKCRVKLKFFTGITYVTGTANGSIFRGNGPFDPDNDAPGSQPGGYDQWAAFYSHYRVFGSQFTLSLVNIGADPCRILVLPQLTTTNPGIADGAEQPYATVRNMSSVNGGGKVFIKKYMRSKKIFGRSQESTAYSSLVTSVPNVQWYWKIRASSLTLNDLNLDGRVEILYYMEFYARNTMIES